MKGRIIAYERKGKGPWTKETRGKGKGSQRKRTWVLELLSREGVAKKVVCKVKKLST